MRSIVLTLGNEVHHLRYPFQVVEDIDQLLKGGFYSVFNREADVPTCHLLLWAGLQHEGVTYEQAGYYLICEGATYKNIPLIGFWKKIVDALTLDKWISIGEGEDDQKNDAPLREVIADMEQIALSEFNMKPEEFYGITPREFGLYRDKYGLRDNYRAGLICATLANTTVRKPGGGAWQPEDFIRTGTVQKIQTAEEQAAIMASMFRG
jgi:hypothetical protein